MHSKTTFFFNCCVGYMQHVSRSLSLSLILSMKTCKSLSTCLCLREPQWCGELGSLRQSQILSLLEPPVQSLQLETGVDGSGFADLFAFAVETNLSAFHHGVFLWLWCWEGERKETVSQTVHAERLTSLCTSFTGGTLGIISLNCIHCL